MKQEYAMLQITCKEMSEFSEASWEATENISKTSGGLDQDVSDAGDKKLSDSVYVLNIGNMTSEQMDVEFGRK